MRVAFIADVHSNYPALVNVVEDALSNNVDKFVFVGDYIFDLPFSNEVTRYLMKMKNAHIIKGNKELYLDKLANDNQANWIYSQMGCVYQTFRELSSDAHTFLRDLDEECYTQLDHGASVYAVHVPKFLAQSLKNKCNSSNYHKKMLEEPFTHQQFLGEFRELVNSGECKSLVEQVDANIIVFGHNHLQSHAYCGDKLIINPGSCGLPLDFNPAAPYTILETTASGLNVIEKRVAYDIESTIMKAKTSSLYKKGKIWSDLVFLALKTGRDYFGFFFDIAGQIALSKRETASLFSNSTWEEANEIFIKKYKDVL